MARRKQRDLAVFESSWHQSTTHSGGLTLSLLMLNVKKESLKIIVKAYLFFLSMSWIGWGKTKQALMHIIIKRYHLPFGPFFSPSQPLPDCVSCLEQYKYTILVVYNNKVIRGPKTIFEITFSLTMCAWQTRFVYFLPTANVSYI